MSDVKRYYALGDLVSVTDNTDCIIAESPHVVLASDYDALAARCAELEALVSRIYRKACKEQYETTMLMSNPAQNPAAYYIKTMIEESRLSHADSENPTSRTPSPAPHRPG